MRRYASNRANLVISGGFFKGRWVVKFVIAMIFAGLGSEAAGQTGSMSGLVTDTTGMPLPGVSVEVKYTGQGTVTDNEGRFRLEGIADTSVLEFSFLGFETLEVSPDGRTELKVALRVAQSQLDEVVVVGYGTQRKINLTGAVSQVDAEDIAMRPAANVVSSLQGLLPGLNIQKNTGDPTSAGDINIRGFNSINGGGPLILIDGIEGDITRVNPRDIENVTVLKDAASAAIYGARGAFGVILITTKTGRAGEMVVNYSNNFNWTTPTTRTDFITDPYLYGKTVDAAIFGYNGSSYTGYNEADWETIRQVASGERAPFHEEQSNGNHKFFHKTDWYSYLFRKWQPSQIHNISISGGSDKLRGYLSGRLYERSTIQNIVDSKVKRNSINANVSYQPVSWLEISDNIKFTDTEDGDYLGYRNGYGDNLWSARTLWWLMPFQPNFINGQPFDHHGTGTPPALEDGNNWRLYKTEEFTNTFRAKLTPVKGLEVNFDYSNRITHTARTYRYNEFSQLTGDRIEEETVGINRLGEWRWRDYYKAMNIYGTYTLSLNDAHNFKLLAGYNQEDFDQDRIAAQQSGLLVRELSNLTLGTEMYNIDGSALLWAVRGYFGRFNYNYKQKYLLEVNARYDGSSRFPEESRWGLFPSVSAGWQINRERFWEPLENTFSFLKLRVSYGKLGNQSVPVNTFQQLMGIGQSDWLNEGSPLNYASAPGPLPRVVSWETTRVLNFGLDIGVLQNKLMASLDWYEKNIEGMYLPGEPLPAVFGAAEPRENLAELRNKGFELGLNYHDSFNVGGEPLSLEVAASVSDFNGVITRFKNPNGLMSSYWEGQELGQIWGYHVDGQFQSDEEALAYQESFDDPSSSLGEVYRYELNSVQNADWNRLKAGDLKYVDIDGDGRIDRGDYTLEDHGDLRPIGNAMPSFPFGFNINARWKGFDVSVAGAGVGKQHWYPTGDIYWGTYNRPYSSFLRKDLVEKAWTPEQPGNPYPQIERGYAALNQNRMMSTTNDYYLINVGYLRVKNLTVGYTLPAEFTEKLKIRKLRVYFSGENIMTWRFGDLSKYIDPEQAASAISYSDPGNAVSRSGVESYPMGKTFSMGIDLSL